MRTDPETGHYPILREQTPVRLDLTIADGAISFFLAMERPDLARSSISVSIFRLESQVSRLIKRLHHQLPAASGLLVNRLRLTAVDLAGTHDYDDLSQILILLRII